MKESPGTKKSIRSSLKYISVSLMALLSGLLLMGERIEGLLKSIIWSVFHVVLDIFRFELLAILLILMFWKHIRNIGTRLYKCFTTICDDRFNILESRNRQEYLLAVLAIAMLPLLLFQGYKYCVGKRIFFNNYHRLMVAEASVDFLQGKPYKALRELRICARLFDNQDCRELEETLKKRLNHAESLKTLFGAAPLGSPQKVELLEDIYYLDRDQLFYEESASVIEKKYDTLLDKYVQALTYIRGGEGLQAEKKLEEIQKEAPGFGECHLLRKELESFGLSCSCVEVHMTPYLCALERYGVKKFVTDTVRRLQPAPLKDVERKMDISR